MCGSFALVRPSQISCRFGLKINTGRHFEQIRRDDLTSLTKYFEILFFQNKKACFFVQKKMKARRMKNMHEDDFYSSFKSRVLESKLCEKVNLKKFSQQLPGS